MKIKISPPFFKTGIAYICYVIIFFCLVVIFNHFYLSKIRLSYRLIQEQQEKERQDILNQNKLRFFTNISHEFQTPLTLIIGSLELIKKSPNLSGSVKKRISLAYNSATRLKRLSSELLDFRKIDQGHLKLKVQELNIIEYVDSVYTAFSEIAKSRKVDFSFIKPDENISIWFDPDQIDKVIYNLLSNSFKFIDNKTGKIGIEIVDHPTQLEINIKDNGKGISADEINKVFGRFYQAKETPTEITAKGTGIGLALSKAIVDAHCGTISVTSQPGEETCFTVILMKGNSHFTPDQLFVVEEEKTYEVSFNLENDTEILAEEDSQLLSSEENFKTLLIIDDNHQIIHLVKEIFGDNYSILEAHNGEEGMNIAIEQQPDLIISDVKMPILSGIEMSQILKRNIHTSHIPIILLTARTAMDHKIEGIQSGADDYITKPFSTDYLSAKVENIFKNQEILQKKYSKDPKTEVKSITHSNIDQEFLGNAQKIIEEHIMDTNFSITVFANEMGYSRTLFYRKIKVITGQTPNDFIQTIRLKKSAELLLSDPDKSISDVAYDVGFSSPRYFSKCFRNHFGVLPSKYAHIGETKETEED